MKENGYKTLAFSSGYTGTELKKADFYVVPPGTISEFNNSLIRMTPLYAFHYRLLHHYGLGYEFHRRRLSFVLDNLAEAPETNGPLFVFCHLVAPHPPFLFDEVGRFVPQYRPFDFADSRHLHGMDKSLMERYRARYVQQLQFINNKIKTAIDGILQRTNGSAIIILQEDHGPGTLMDLGGPYPDDDSLVMRSGILNALHVPDSIRGFLYADMSPVNTFRIIFRHWFGRSFETLADKTYFSVQDGPFKWTEVTDRVW